MTDALGELARSCAVDLEAVYGDGFVEHVEAALAGGVRSGQSRHMVDWASVGSVTDISSLLVSMFGTAISYIQFRQSAPTSLAQGGPIEVVNADIAAIDEAIEDAISDLGREQRDCARKLKGEICNWLERRHQP